MFKLGYNTNGFTSHSLLSAIEIIGDLGYDSIAITIDHHSLNPYEDDIDSKIEAVKKKLDSYSLSSMIETGARFLLNPAVKHEPTLISNTKEKRDARIAFIEKSLYIASKLGSHAVSIWSGKKNPEIKTQDAWDWLVSGCKKVSQMATDHGVFIGFEPEPGMMIENMTQYQQLKTAVDSRFFKLTLDLGHAFITEESVVKTLRTHKDDIVNIHLEDMKKDKHDHLLFGHGDMNFQEIFNTIRKIDYSGQVNIELSRHSHDAVTVSKNAIEFINSIKKDSTG